MKSFVSAASDAACSLPVRTCALGGRISSIWRMSSCVRHVRLGGDGDLVELPDLLEESLCGREVEAGERRSADREARAELDDARDPHVLRPGPRPARRRSPRPRSPPSPPSPCRRRPRSAPATSPSMSVSGLKTESPFAIEKPRFGAPPKTTAFPSSPMNCVASESTLPSACATSGSSRTCGSSDSSRVGCGHPGLVSDVEGRLARDDGVRALADVGEDPVERLVDRVGQDERPADHRDAEDDRDRRERGAELPAQQPADRRTRPIPPGYS